MVVLVVGPVLLQLGGKPGGTGLVPLDQRRWTGSWAVVERLYRPGGSWVVHWRLYRDFCAGKMFFMLSMSILNRNFSLVASMVPKHMKHLRLR